MKSLLSLSFLPHSPDLALLLLRVWLGTSMLIIHGWPKLLKLTSGEHKFPDPLHIGTVPSLTLAVVGEVAGAILLVLGLWGRLAAFMLATTMGVAWAMTHQMKLVGEGSGELAFIYLAGFLAILIAGSGKFSVDGN